MGSPGRLQDPIWTKGIDAARHRGRKVRVLLLAMFAIQVAAAVFRDWRDLLLLGLDLGLFAIVAAHALRVPPDASLVELSDSLPLHASLLADIHELARHVDVRMSVVPVLINRTNLGASPCVRSRKRPRFLGLGASEPLLEIPVGFLQMYQRERPAALAVLAHELAHIRHRDWESWAFASAAANVIRWITLPAACAMALWAAAGLCDFGPVYVATQHKIENARDYAEILADARAERARNSMPSGLAALLNPGLAGTQREMNRTPDEQLVALRYQLIEGVTTGAALLLMPLSSLLWLSWILRLRKATEIAADRIAALTTSPGAVRRALTMYDTGRARWQWLSAHPSIQSRLAALAGLGAATGSAALDAASSPQQANRVRPKGISSPGALQKWLHPAAPRLRLQRTALFGLPLVLAGIGGNLVTEYLMAVEMVGNTGDNAPLFLDVLMASLADTRVQIVLATGAAIAIVVLACLKFVRSTLAAAIMAALASGLTKWWLDRMAFAYIIAPELSLTPEAPDPLAVIRQVLLTAVPLLVFLLAFDRMLARHAPLPAYTLATASSVAAYWLVMVVAPGSWTGELPQFSQIFSRGLGDAVARFITFAVCAIMLWMPSLRRARQQG